MVREVEDLGSRAPNRKEGSKCDKKKARKKAAILAQEITSLWKK